MGFQHDSTRYGAQICRRSIQKVSAATTHARLLLLCKQASRHVTLSLLRDGVIACCGSRIKIFPKIEKLWTEILGLFNYLSFIKSWHGVNKGPKGVSHFLSRITLAHCFCTRLITSWNVRFVCFIACSPDNNPRRHILAG